MTRSKDDEPESGVGGKPALTGPKFILRNLGANIQRMRKQQGLTSDSLSAQTRAQAALGQSCAVSAKTIVAIEESGMDPSLSAIHAIAKALGVTIDVLVY